MKNTASEDARSRLIFALDVGGGTGPAFEWVDRLQARVGLFKVGKESFTACGPDLVAGILARGGKVFLDLKFHDIPNTVGGAATAATKLGVSMFNVHALGGEAMLKEAAEAARRTAEKLGRPAPAVLAVTVLTSLDDADLQRLGFRLGAGELALHLAEMAKRAGVSGVVASARDAVAIRERCGKDFMIVTPGIRGSAKPADDDQKRTLSPRDAIRMGADYIVVGRPIRTSADPAAEADAISAEIAGGLAARGRG